MIITVDTIKRDDGRTCQFEIEWSRGRAMRTRCGDLVGFFWFKGQLEHGIVTCMVCLAA